MQVAPEERGGRIPSQVGRSSYSAMSPVVGDKRMGAPSLGPTSDRPAPPAGEASRSQITPSGVDDYPDWDG